jgi:hypothetical protein
MEVEYYGTYRYKYVNLSASIHYIFVEQFRRGLKFLLIIDPRQIECTVIGYSKSARGFRRPDEMIRSGTSRGE